MAALEPGFATFKNEFWHSISEFCRRLNRYQNQNRDFQCSDVVSHNLKKRFNASKAHLSLTLHLARVVMCKTDT